MICQRKSEMRFIMVRIIQHEWIIDGLEVISELQHFPRDRLQSRNAGYGTPVLQSGTIQNNILDPSSHNHIA
jgi:hypothetical protein